MSYFIIVFLIILILLTSVLLFEYRFGNKWVYTDNNQCSKKVLFGSYSSKLDCLYENMEVDDTTDFFSLIPFEVLNKPKKEEKIVDIPQVNYQNDKSLTKKASKYPNFNFETPKIKTYDLKSAGYDFNTLKN